MQIFSLKNHIAIDCPQKMVTATTTKTTMLPLQQQKQWQQQERKIHREQKAKQSIECRSEIKNLLTLLEWCFIFILKIKWISTHDKNRTAHSFPHHSLPHHQSNTVVRWNESIFFGFFPCHWFLHRQNYNVNDVHNVKVHGLKLAGRLRWASGRHMPIFGEPLPPPETFNNNNHVLFANNSVLDCCCSFGVFISFSLHIWLNAFRSHAK